MTPTSATAQTTTPSRDQVVRYIQHYQGGDCFFIKPTSVTADKAMIMGYGQQPETFTQLDDAFKRTFGFEAEIGVVVVTSPQCPAINAVSRFGDRANTVRIVLHTATKPGDPRAGTVHGLRDRPATLLLVSATGEVQNLSHALVGAGDSRSFSFAPATAAKAKTPQLLVAVSGADATEALNAVEATSADQAFARLENAMKADPSATAEIQAFH